MSDTVEEQTGAVQVRESQIEVTHEASSAELISQAIAKGSDLVQMEKLLELQIKVDAIKAKKAFVVAMAQFKENPPKIKKDSKVDFTSAKGRTFYNYASLADVTNVLIPSLSKHGLSATWRTKQNGKVDVTCVMTHILGHSEETSLAADSDSSGGKNSIQAIGSTVSYLQRYTILAICGLSTFENDDDGAGSTAEYITAEQKSTLLDHLNDKSVSEGKLLKVAGVSDIDKITVKQYPGLITQLTNIKKKEDTK